MEEQNQAARGRAAGNGNNKLSKKLPHVTERAPRGAGFSLAAGELQKTPLPADHLASVAVIYFPA
jgi:hypothetical protein